MRVKFEKLKAEMKRVLQNHCLSEEKADKSAEMFVWNSVDGIASHGANRFPRVVDYIKKGYIKVDAEPVQICTLGAFEQWDGNLGMGNLNAHFCMDRAMKLAQENGIGLVALRNTNHWLRGGAYGWQAADAGYAGICWTNTQPNMPPWGSTERKIGNNPFILAIPRKKGNIVFDGAMAQYSYGKIEETMMKNQLLPFPGGFDSDGSLSSDPKEIQKTWRVLPMGYWKGSGLSIVLDLLAATLSKGNTVHEVGKLGDDEYALSQVFIAIDVHNTCESFWLDKTLDQTIDEIKNASRVKDNVEILYPGERELCTRKDNLENGVIIDKKIWDMIRSL